MNRKRRATHYLSSMLAMPALVCLSLVLFTACSDNDEPAEEVTYSWGFADLSASSPDFMDDINKIESTFKASLGASGPATSVTKKGTSETCDKAVLEACQQALESLKGNVWQGHYTFIVTNVTTGAVIFTHIFDADDDNSVKSYTASDLKIGDYIYDDGTTSDGGLRGIKGDSKIVWAESKPQPENGKNVVGIVFWTPSETTVDGRKTPASLMDDKIMSAEHPDCTHGLAVALKNITYNGSETMVWQLGWTIEYVANWQAGGDFTHEDKSKFTSIGTGFEVDDNINRIYGYQNTIVLCAYNAYCQKSARKSNYIMQPVAALDEFVSGNASPAGSTGWFIPSVKELFMLCSKDMDDVADVAGVRKTYEYVYSLTRDIVDSSLATAGGDVLGSTTFWTSSEASARNACLVRFNYGQVYVGGLLKGIGSGLNVRAVCAF